MLTKQELTQWLESISDEDGIYIDDAGLTLCSESGAYIEVGGEPQDEDEAEKPITEPIIQSIDRRTINGDCTLIGFFSDNAERKLFSFYVDELSFDDSELIGKTEIEVHHLHQQKTVAYLQS